MSMPIQPQSEQYPRGPDNTWHACATFWQHPDPAFAHSSVQMRMKTDGPEHAADILSQYPKSHRIRTGVYGNDDLGMSVNFGRDTRTGDENEAAINRYKSFRNRAARNGHDVVFDQSNHVSKPPMDEETFHGHIGLLGPERRIELHEQEAQKSREQIERWNSGDYS